MGADSAFDPRSNSLRVIQEEHGNVHDGHAYIAFLTTTLTPANLNNFSIMTGVKPIHLEWEVMSDQAMTVSILESPTILGGSPFTAIYNKNRGSSNVTACTILNGGTASGGTLIYNIQARTVAPPTTPIVLGGGPRSLYELILASNTQYNYQVFNNGAATANITIQLHWYELGN